jgi:hypothetical protein
MVRRSFRAATAAAALPALTALAGIVGAQGAAQWNMRSLPERAPSIAFVNVGVVPMDAERMA